jgi:hypothetical protein
MIRCEPGFKFVLHFRLPFLLSKRYNRVMGITPHDFQILAHVLYAGAASAKTLRQKYGPDPVEKLISEGYLTKFAERGGFLSLTKLGRKTVTLGVV